MRFLNRQLLRSIIAAGLAVVGSSTGLASPGFASPGKMSIPWQDICFINDGDSPFPTSDWRTAKPTDCYLGFDGHKPSVAEANGRQEEIYTAECNQESRDCLIASNPIIKFIAEEDLQSRISANLQLSLQSTAQWFSGWTSLRTEAVQSFQSQTAKLIRSMNYVVATDAEENAPPAAEFFKGNLFVYVLEEATESQSAALPRSSEILTSVIQYQDIEAEIAAEVAAEFEAYHQAAKLVAAQNHLHELSQELGLAACPAEAYATTLVRPPCLEGDLAWEAPRLDEIDGQLADPHGAGHCRVPEPSEPHLQLSGLMGRSVIERWFDPNWDVHTWAYSSNDSLDPESTKYQPGLWTQPILDRWVSSVYSVQASIDWERIEAPEASALTSVTTGMVDNDSSAEPSLEEASRVATKAFALKLKQLGELLIESADRLNQVSDAIDVASRGGTQR